MESATDSFEIMTAEEPRSDAAWRRIYEDSFPASEQESLEVISEGIQCGAGMALRSLLDGTTSGLATTHLLTGPAAVFLVYLAVDPAKRSHGVGRKLLEFAWESGAERLKARGLKPSGLIWEIDTLDPGAEDSSARERRVAFFRKAGGQVIDRPYHQPPIDGVASVPMTLMFRPAQGEVFPSTETVDALVKAIYFEKYGAINKIAPSILEELLTRR